MAKFYITTPIYYINSVPHIGHAYTTVVADALARWHRLRGDDVFFLTGLDENSAKTLEAAKEKGFKDIQAYADSMANLWQSTWKILNISNDDFVRTTQERHRKNVIELFERIRARGDIYKGTYEGLYCEGCEGYYTEAELVDGKCPLHLTKPKLLKEENYFFRLSKYADALLKHIEENPEFIQPEARRNEVINFIKQGLKDISITRQNQHWGIDVPGEPGQKIWVWFDALTNYLLPKQYWPADVHIIAKDILRFHCVIWPSMLLSAGIELPKKIFAHGFLTVEGQKISKSLGNVIDPVYLVEKYSADVVRYFLIREVSFGQDGNFSEAGLEARLNDELADVLGNFVHRVLTFIRDRYGSRLPNGKIDGKIEGEIKKRVERIEQMLLELKVSQALEEIMAIARRGNEYFQACRPWEALKREKEKAAECILTCANLVKILCVALTPFMPSTAAKLAHQLAVEVKSWEQAKSFDLGPEHQIGEPVALFAKIKSSGEEKREGKLISIDEFGKLDIRVGRVIAAEMIPKSKKLIKLEADLGKERRTIVAGIAEKYSPESLVGKNIAVVANLEPAKLMGVVSEGMLLAAEDENGVSILVTDRPVQPGSKVR
ncbi:MAG: methionine--tRNA ligase [Candidatus Hadarchaeum sp.]|uniref:methionine--tRNA ligase n=1 Tax=Candidatus Hadarchaeum sp. TaxID=2883567 RepID=UPI003D11EEED